MFVAVWPHYTDESRTEIGGSTVTGWSKGGLRIGLIREMDMECHLAPEMAFGPGEILEGEPVLKALHELTQLVEDITNAFLAAGLIR
jgi:hypothetical protein